MEFVDCVQRIKKAVQQDGLSSIRVAGFYAALASAARLRRT